VSSADGWFGSSSPDSALSRRSHGHRRRHGRWSQSHCSDGSRGVESRGYAFIRRGRALGTNPTAPQKKGDRRRPPGRDRRNGGAVHRVRPDHPRRGRPTDVHPVCTTGRNPGRPRLALLKDGYAAIEHPHVPTAIELEACPNDERPNAHLASTEAAPQMAASSGWLNRDDDGVVKANVGRVLSSRGYSEHDAAEGAVSSLVGLGCLLQLRAVHVHC
jgi:hypothetical protein